jgi:hypothetical protein
MLKRTFFAVAASVLGLGLTSTLIVHLPVQAQSCRPLRVVDGRGFEVRKRIDGRPGGVIVSNNWNTDFAVPPGVRFRSYAVSITPENDAPYDISIHFKYPNNSSSTVFQNNSLKLARWRSWNRTFQSPTSRQPYQINLRIGGTNGNFYRARVSACQ